MPAAVARKRAGFSRDQAAKRLRLSVRTLDLYERGRGPSAYIARKMARLYGCSVFGCFTEQGIALQTNAEFRDA